MLYRYLLDCVLMISHVWKEAKSRWKYMLSCKMHLQSVQTVQNFSCMEE